MVERYAICKFYAPFTMGGTVWPFQRFKVEAEDCKLATGFKGFVVAHDGIHSVYEAVTGGLLGESKTKRTAISTANKNIKETPDLREQIQSLGDTSRFPEVTAEEAYRRIAKTQKNRK